MARPFFALTLCLATLAANKAQLGEAVAKIAAAFDASKKASASKALVNAWAGLRLKI